MVSDAVEHVLPVAMQCAHSAMQACKRPAQDSDAPLSPAWWMVFIKVNQVPHSLTWSIASCPWKRCKRKGSSGGHSPWCSRESWFWKITPGADKSA